MYLNILKKDLKRKKTMNIILLIFIILATMFITSSGNNIISIVTTLDDYIIEAELADYFMVMYDDDGVEERVRTFLEKEEIISDYKLNKLLLGSSQNIDINNKKTEYANLIILGRMEDIQYKVFDKDDTVLTNINDGEIYLSLDFLKTYNLETGDVITLKNEQGYKKEFKIAGGVKSIIYGTPRVGCTVYMISDNDYQEIMKQEGFNHVWQCSIVSEEPKELAAVVSGINLSLLLAEPQESVYLIYLIDMVVAAVMLIVSICLILISMVILRFTIAFTLNEEFREIGVMKAIGINDNQIRRLYSIKYCGISLIGTMIGILLGLPFGELLLYEVSQNIIINGSNNYWINLLGAGGVVLIIIIFCFLVTGKLKKITPITAIRNGSNGERYHGRNILALHKSWLKPISFLSLNDIFSGLRKFFTLILTFTIGIFLIIIPLNTANTLKSENIVQWFGMAKSDLYIAKNLYIERTDFVTKESYQELFEDLEQRLLDDGIIAQVFTEVHWSVNFIKGEKSTNAISMQGVGISTEEYSYTKGSAPQNDNEIALTHITADTLEANIGDTIRVVIGEMEQEFIITAIFQSMMNMGKGARFSENFDLDYAVATGNMALQVRYLEEPNKMAQAKSLELIEAFYPDTEIFLGGEYIADLINVNLDDMISLIIIIVIGINALIAVLMVKSFIIREKGEIAMLKALGFRDNSLIKWQILRMGIIIIISTILGAVLSIPLAQISAGQVFKMMGASSIIFEIKALEVYVIYPFIILIATIVSSFIAAQDIRKISASKTSDIE